MEIVALSYNKVWLLQSLWPNFVLEYIVQILSLSLRAMLTQVSNTMFCHRRQTILLGPHYLPQLVEMVNCQSLTQVTITLFFLSLTIDQ